MEPISHSFFSNLIDYAGLFPPTRLPLEQALENYQSYITGPDRWMLGRFICPVDSLQYLTDASLPYAISVVLGTDKSFTDNLNKIITFNTENAGKKTIQSLEIKFNVNNLHDRGSELISQVTNCFDEHVDVQNIFIELPPEYQKSESTVINFLAQQKRSFGIKLRCGGEIPPAFPSVRQMGTSLRSCALAGIPFKATAGLHHPFRHRDELMNVKQHGFINLFAAAMFLSGQKIDLASVIEILEDEDQDNFQFKGEQLLWKKLSLRIEEVQSIRHNFAISFGSCSFTEPLDDLHYAGLIN
jgi:hypothetical protein